MIEEVLDEVFHGKCNMCIAAEKAGVQLEELKRLLEDYILERPLDVNDAAVGHPNAPEFHDIAGYSRSLPQSCAVQSGHSDRRKRSSRL